MAEWAYKEFVCVGDAFGNPKRVAFGKVTINDRTSLGIQVDVDHPRVGDLPDFTVDTETGRELLRELAHQLAAIYSGRDR